MPKLASKLGMYVLCALSLVVLLVVFELRYVWYLSPSELWALRGGFAVGALALIALWVWFPFRIATAVLGLATLTFPTLLPGHRPPVSVGFVTTAFFCIALLVAATEVRRRVVYRVSK